MQWKRQISMQHRTRVSVIIIIMLNRNKVLLLKSGRIELSQNLLQLHDTHNGSVLGLVYTDYLSAR